jgi:TatD DNase family protein
MSAFVDAHCHIDLYKLPKQIVEQAETNHIYTIAVTNAPSVFAHTFELAAGCKYVRAAIGLHPELVHTHKHEIDQFRRYLPQTRYVGEVGLDYTTPDKSVRLAQRQILATIAEWVNECEDKILTIHSRRAASDVIASLRGIKAKLILHWFTGTNKELECAIDGGFFFSVNGAMLRSERVRALILSMPQDRVLTETDGPFVDDGPTPATPATVTGTVNGLAELWNRPASEVQSGILDTFRRILAT